MDAEGQPLPVPLDLWCQARVVMSYQPAGRCVAMDQPEVALYQEVQTVRHDVRKTEDGLVLCSSKSISRGPFVGSCPLCEWTQVNVLDMLDVWDPVAHPLLGAPCGRRDGLFWLSILTFSEEDVEWMVAVLLGMVQRAASLPPPPGDALGQGPGNASGGSLPTPPTFALCFGGHLPSIWQDARTWEPLSEVCDLLIVRDFWDRPVAEGEKVIAAIARLLGDRGRPGARPAVLVLA
jgi:hypothetical protein